MSQTFCPACGAANTPDSVFCVSCGNPLAPAAAPGPQADPGGPVEYLAPYGAAPAPGGTGRRTGLIVGGVVLVLALGGVGLFLTLNGSKSETEKVEDAIAVYVDAVENRDCQAFVDVVEFEENSDEEILEACEADDGTGDTVVHEFTVTEVELSDGDTRATAHLEVDYTDEGEDRDTEDEDLTLQKIDGDWVITAID